MASTTATATTDTISTPRTSLFMEIGGNRDVVGYADDLDDTQCSLGDCTLEEPGPHTSHWCRVNVVRCAFGQYISQISYAILDL